MGQGADRGKVEPRRALGWTPTLNVQAPREAPRSPDGPLHQRDHGSWSWRPGTLPGCCVTVLAPRGSQPACPVPCAPALGGPLTLLSPSVLFARDHTKDILSKAKRGFKCVKSLRPLQWGSSWPSSQRAVEAWRSILHRGETEAQGDAPCGGGLPTLSLHSA